MAFSVHYGTDAGAEKWGVFGSWYSTTTVGHLSFNQDPGAVLAHTKVLPAPDNQKENFMLGIKR